MAAIRSLLAERLFVAASEARGRWRRGKRAGAPVRSMPAFGPLPPPLSRVSAHGTPRRSLLLRSHPRRGHRRPPPPAAMAQGKWPAAVPSPPRRPIRIVQRRVAIRLRCADDSLHRATRGVACARGAIRRVLPSHILRRHCPRTRWTRRPRLAAPPVPPPPTDTPPSRRRWGAAAAAAMATSRGDGHATRQTTARARRDAPRSGAAGGMVGAWLPRRPSPSIPASPATTANAADRTRLAHTHTRLPLVADRRRGRHKAINGYSTPHGGATCPHGLRRARQLCHGLCEEVFHEVADFD